jgi:hypothetical protein
MNLVDVTNALDTIVRLNPGLSKDRLVVLLHAANWEEKNIQEAVAIFEKSNHELSLPHVDTENFLEAKYGDTEEQKPPTAQVSLPHVDNENLLEQKNVPPKEGDTRIVERQPEKKSGVTIPSIPLPSFLKKKETVVQPAQQQPHVEEAQHLPEGLPLKAFDSSEHVWTFSEYKEKFHGGVPTPLVKKEEKPKPAPQILVEVPKPSPVPVQTLTPQGIPAKKKSIELDEPLTGSDLSLIVVVSFLFLVIILLVGYMYSNGRLFL